MSAKAKRPSRAKRPASRPRNSRSKQANPPDDFDILIAGGGLVGASLAAALAPLPLKVAMVEAVPFGAPGQPSYDDRVTALSCGSRRIFESIGLWPSLGTEAVPIRSVHVSERGRFGKTRLHAQELSVEALGYVLPNRIIGGALSGFLSRQANLHLLAPAKLDSVDLRPQEVAATVANGAERQVKARLLIVADGAQSGIRKQLGITARTWDYGQNAVVCNVSVERPEPFMAFERFTEQGPVALLPLGEERYALIWTVAHARLEALLGLPDAEFLEAAAARFNGRFGRFLKVGKRNSYALSLVRAESQSRGRALIMGNAAHSLHPIAAQGFNLSLRDVAALAQTLTDCIQRGTDVGDAQVLAGFLKSRHRDQAGTIRFTDFVTRMFTNPLASVGIARNTGLLSLELLPMTRHGFMRRNTGLIGNQTRLTRRAKSP